MTERPLSPMAAAILRGAVVLGTMIAFKLLAEIMGPAGWGMPSGNAQMAGFALAVLAFTCFAIQSFDDRAASISLIAWIQVLVVGCLVFAARAVLMGFGVLDPVAQPPAYIKWLFEPWLMASFALLLGR